MIINSYPSYATHEKGKMHFFEKEKVSLYLDDLISLECLSSDKQQIKLFQHPLLGLVLVINGEIQHIEKYQCFYHEPLVHLPMVFCPEPQYALIIGGGSLFAAFEILKYPSIKKVVLCDHDHVVLNLMQKYYNHAKCVLSDNRFSFVEADGIEFVYETDESYDIIVNDCFNILKTEEQLNISLYAKMNDLLTPLGVCVDIIYRHIFDNNITRDSIRAIQKISNLALSLITVPEYPGIFHIETVWGKSPYISQDCKLTNNEYQKRCIKEETIPFDYFSPENIPFYLYLPPYIKSYL